MHCRYWDNGRKKRSHVDFLIIHRSLCKESLESLLPISYLEMMLYSSSAFLEKSLLFFVFTVVDLVQSDDDWNIPDGFRVLFGELQKIQLFFRVDTLTSIHDHNSNVKGMPIGVDIVLVLGARPSLVDARYINNHEFGVISHFMKRFVELDIKRLHADNVAVAMFRVIHRGLLQGGTRRTRLLDNLNQIIFTFVRCIVNCSLLLLSKRAEVIDNGRATAHRHFTILGAKQSVDDSCLSYRYVTNHRHANLEFAATYHDEYNARVPF
mmetsp:Transcript_9353/g.17844  ORF Transcript_9353/g.17844 Transcript_9353/m.17844 type:complete len:266 (+) Transcript_9353:691-1488(+)